MKKILLMLMFVVITGCSGPDNKSTCIPSKSAADETALDGSPIASADQIDKKLEEAKIITTIVEKIKKLVVGDGPGFSGAEKLFTGFVNSPMVNEGIYAAFILYIILFGIMAMGGMLQLTLGDAVLRFIKVGFIATFALNWADFYDLIGRTSMDFTDEMLSYFLNAFKAKFTIGSVTINVDQNVFTKLDYFVAKMFSMKMMAVLGALLNDGSSGPAYAILIVVAVFFTFKAILTVVLVYCFSLFARAMLFAVAPIFIALLLFKQTQPLFDSWVKQLINYSLQPVLVGAFLGFFLAVMEPFFQEFLKYEVCWLPNSSSGDGFSWRFMDPATGNQVDPGANSEPMLELQRILVFMGFAYIFFCGTKLGQAMASALAGTVSGNLSEAAKGLGGLQNFFNKDGKGGPIVKALSSM